MSSVMLADVLNVLVWKVRVSQTCEQLDDVAHALLAELRDKPKTRRLAENVRWHPVALRFVALRKRRATQ